MENKLFEKLDDLNVTETNFLLEKDINLSLNHLAMKRVEKSVKRKAGYHNLNNIFNRKIKDTLGGFIMKRKIALALAVVAVSSLGGGVYAHAKTSPVAYVSVDINPSVELGVNAFDEVLSVEAYNEDGEKVLEGTNLVNKDVEDAIKIIIANAVSDGYVKQDNTAANNEMIDTATTAAAVEITVSTDKDKVADKLEDSLKESADKALEENNVKAEVETENVALARRDEARELGITPGKLNLIQKLQALDPNIKTEDYKASSVKDIQKKTIELRKMNKSGDSTTDNTTIDNNTNTDVNTNISTSTNTSTDSISEQSINTSTKENGNSQKEEKYNNGNKKDDDSEAERGDVNKSIKQKNNDNSNSQNNSNKEKNKNN